jgi:ArsR family transcriptional regulator, lead/cadmium/zinc/bismuth-responsive transcriptional repressor
VPKPTARSAPHAHAHPPSPRKLKLASDEALARAAALFRAVGDVHRLRLIEYLASGERCVSELAEASGTKMSTLSQQLRVLRQERIVSQRREGKHVFYALADAHIRDLAFAALRHAEEEG